MNHSLDLEDAVIGALLLESHWLTHITPILKPECFYSSKNGLIYEAILNLDKKREVIDIFTVTQELSKMGKLQSVGGAYAVSSLGTKSVGGPNIETHALKVYQLFILRKTEEIAIRVQSECREPKADAPEILFNFLKELSSLNYIGKSKEVHIADAVGQVISESKYAIEHGVKSGYLSGWRNLDNLFSRQPQDFGVIAARPGMGKTAYMLSLAYNSALKGNPTVIFSLEMSTIQLASRLTASLSNINAKLINEKKVSAGQLLTIGSIIPQLENVPLYIDDTPILHVEQLRSSIRRYVEKYGIKEVWVDYLQLMAGEKKGNREQEISYISRNLKRIAKEENIPVIALSQLSREVEKRPDKRPMLSDLRESGAIEQDADWVQFLYRPTYYGAEEYPETFEGQQRDVQGNGWNMLVVNGAKYRGGSPFECALKFYGEFMRIDNYDYNGFSEPTFNKLENNTDFL